MSSSDIKACGHYHGMCPCRVDFAAHQPFVPMVVSNGVDGIALEDLVKALKPSAGSCTNCDRWEARIKELEERLARIRGVAEGRE